MESKSESQISEGPPRKPIVWRWTEQGYLPFIDVPYMPRKDFTGSASDSISEPTCGVKAHKIFVTDNKQIQQLYDENLFRQISNVEHIKATTDELNNLKDTIRDKKKLKEKRNIQTAKLSRDRKKLEVEFMREVGIAYVTFLNKIRNLFGKIASSSHG